MAAAAAGGAARAGAAARGAAGTKKNIASLRHRTGSAATVARAGRAAPAGSKRATAGRAAETYIAAKAAAPTLPRGVKTKASGAQSAVITSVVVIVGAGFLHAWLVEKRTLPARSFFVRMAILGFVLALMTELAPRVGKFMAYLIMTAVIFDRSRDILGALDKSSRRPTMEPEGPPPEIFTDQVQPVLYSRTGPMPSEVVLPARTRAPRPQRGALYLS